MGPVQGRHQHAREDDRQARRRDAVIGKGQDERIDADDEIQQRDLTRKRGKLRLHQIVILGRNSEQSGLEAGYHCLDAIFMNSLSKSRPHESDLQ